MSENSVSSPKIEWSKISRDNQEYTPDQRQLYEQVVGRALASAEVLRRQATELGLEVSQDTLEILFILFSEVIYDLLSASGINESPYVVPVPNLGEKKIAAYYKDRDTGRHIVIFSSEKIARAALILDKALESNDPQNVNFATDEVAEAIYAIAHELGHLRQEEKLSSFKDKAAQPHNTANWEHTQANLLAYNNDLAETNAHAVVIRYLKAKKEARKMNPIWKVLDFSRIIGKNIESQGRYKMLADVLSAQILLEQRDKTLDVKEYQKLQAKAEILVKRLQTMFAKLDKAHQRLGSVAPPEPEAL